MEWINNTMSKLVLVFGALVLSLLASTTTVEATVYSGSFDPAVPVSWSQGSAPYSGNSFAYCSEGTFGPCSCGIHSLATILLKTEYWDAGKIATDAYALSQEFGIGSNYSGTPSYNWPKVEGATNGHLKFEADYWGSSTADSHNYIREQYNKGNFMILSVKTNGVGHLVAVDYVEDDGDIVIVDSAIRAKYLTQMDGGYVRNVTVYSVDGLDARDAAHFWKGDTIGKVGREAEIKELQEELELLKSELEPEDSTESVSQILELINSLEQTKVSETELKIAETNELIDERIKELNKDTINPNDVDERDDVSTEDKVDKLDTTNEVNN